MPEVNEKVMEAVRQELEKNPNISNDELQAKVAKLDPSIAELTTRQFNARYPLQVRRAMSMAAGGGRRRRRTRRVEGDREKVRGVLLELAHDVARAEGKGDVIDVIAGLDKYVEKVVQVAGKR